MNIKVLLKSACQANSLVIEKRSQQGKWKSCQKTTNEKRLFPIGTCTQRPSCLIKLNY